MRPLARPGPLLQLSVDGWTVLGAMVLSLVLRLLVVGQSTWGDELYLYEIVHGHGLGRALMIVHDTESTPPLYFVLAWVAAQIGSDDFLWTRLPALALSVATVPLLYALGRRTVGRRAGLVGAVLFAITPFDIFYGTEARTYAAIVFLCAASTYSLLRLLDSGGRRWAVALAISTAAAAYAHYLVLFVLVAQLGWALAVHRRRAAVVLWSYAGAALLYAPWVPGALFQFHDNTSDRLTQPLSPSGFADGLARVWLGHPFVSPSRIPGTAALIVIAVGFVLATVFSLRGLLAARRRISAARMLIALLALSTPVAALLYQLGPGSIFSPRYMSASVPAGILALAAVLAAPRRVVVSAIAVGCVVAGIAVGTVRAVGPDGQRPDYRAAARALDRTAPPSAPVIEPSIYNGAPARELGFYFRRPHEYFAAGRSLAPVLRLGRVAGRVFVVVPKGGLAIVPFLGLTQHGFRVVSRREWPGTARLVMLTFVPAGAASPPPRDG